MTVHTTAVETNVRVATHDLDTIAAHVPDFEDLDDRARLAALRTVPAEHVGRSRNTTCVGLHQWAVDGLAGNSVPAISEVAVGTGTSSAEANTQLGTEVARSVVASLEPDSPSIYITAFFGSAEANGYDITEAGAFAGDTLLNHATFSAKPKDSQNTLTVECTLTFSAV
ncbi:hypothetical protein ACFPYI_01845 [Halomarina salina]|uniref:Uncharacterized protein n=1 Tax=Halomarina salina TaxID=1872699 RepID=A0ABD5RID0_9EURY|nr:hypothetical protein [Halomarina salina]